MGRFEIAKGITVTPRPKLSRDPPLGSLQVREDFDPVTLITTIRVGVPELRVQAMLMDSHRASKGLILAAMRDQIHAHIDDLFRAHDVPTKSEQARISALRRMRE